MSNAESKYTGKGLETAVTKPGGYWCGKVHHQGTRVFAPGELADSQIDTILADRTGWIAARLVDVAAPEGGAGGTGPAMNAKDTVAKINELTKAEEIEALVKGDERKTVQEAATARIAALAIG